MKIPNADKAIIAPEKIRDYLLNPLHRRGGPKAKFLMTLGYRAENWQQFEGDLREQHLGEDFAIATQTPYGVCYEILAPITSPTGRRARFCSVWQIDQGTESPRLITMYPS